MYQMLFKMEGWLSKTLANFLGWKNYPNRSKRLSLLNLPTEFGESIVFQMALLVHAEITSVRWICSKSKNIILISPLVSRMEDQTNFLREFGRSACWIVEDKAALDFGRLKRRVPHGIFVAGVLTWKWSVVKVSSKNRTFLWKVFVEILCVNSFVFHQYIHYVLTLSSQILLNTVYYNNTQEGTFHIRLCKKKKKRKEKKKEKKKKKCSVLFIPFLSETSHDRI